MPHEVVPIPIHSMKALGPRKVPHAGFAAVQDDNSIICSAPTPDTPPSRALSGQEGIVEEECDLVLFTICGAGGWALGDLATSEA
jgi:hypothetical protein